MIGLHKNMQLYGRDAEIAALSDLLDQARKGTSGTLVLRGDPGIGKSALVSHITARADGFRIISAAGIEEESELPFSGLHLLLRRVLDRITTIKQEIVKADWKIMQHLDGEIV